MKRKRAEYSVAELETIKKELAENIEVKKKLLRQAIAVLDSSWLHADAVDVRDIAQQLVLTIHAVSNVDLYIRMCEMNNEKSVLPFDPVDLGMSHICGKLIG